MQCGVSASKEDVHNAIKNIDKGVFPKAFCMEGFLVPGEEISAIINGTDELLAELREMGVGVYAARCSLLQVTMTHKKAALRMQD